MTIDLEKLAAVPSPTPTRSAEVERGVADSVAYLGSDAALHSIERDPYWPKWNSPWWHMLLLHELGEARQIPSRTSAAMAARMDRLVHLFPIHPSDAPGADTQRDSACHCALGTMYPVLAACGIDVERTLPWVKPWFVRYQMADGGLNCDNTAYLQTGECPSSMVGTVAPLEAMLLGGAGSSEQRAFVTRAGGFLMDRALIHGSRTVHNAEERGAAVAGARSRSRASTSTTCCADWPCWCGGPRQPSSGCRRPRSPPSSMPSSSAGPTASCASSARPMPGRPPSSRRPIARPARVHGPRRSRCSMR
ncbi:hypothetical protein ACN28S_64925 [Cystobacter fuscus]